VLRVCRSVTDSLLQANVMLSYPLDEALELLQRNLDGAQSSLENVMDDLDFLRDQITTMEVRAPRFQISRLPTDRVCAGQHGEGAQLGRQAAARDVSALASTIRASADIVTPASREQQEKEGYEKE